jgi:sarcosine oxidase subunit alpha
MAAGEEFNIKPFGVEAQRVMRLEKGHIIIGQDTDGLTTPHEANMEWAVAKKKPFYVGKRSVDMQAAKPSRRRLLGFKLTDKNAPAPEECHLIIRDGNITGRVTSAVRSPSLDEVVGLAYIEDENTEVGSKFHIQIAGGQLVEAVVAPIPFYDPDNKRQEL